MREYNCTQCRQRITDVSGTPGGDVCATCLHIPGWPLDPKLRQVFHYEPYAEGCLRAFAQELFKHSPDTEAIEGWDLEALAVKHGLLQSVKVTEPCGENCFCLRYGEGFPMECNRPTRVLTGEEL